MSFRYILLHKPYGVVSQFSDRDKTGRPTLKDLVPVANVYPVGRLDIDSEGLLLLTGDGVLQHLLTDPRFGHLRRYWAQLEGVPSARALENLRQGVLIESYRTRPSAAQLLLTDPGVAPRVPPIRFRKSIPTSWIELILTEGRNRQVRKMTAAVGHPTLRLIRVAIGPVRLEGLAQGAWRELSAEELWLLRGRTSAQ